jgi:hypothetical protein
MKKLLMTSYLAGAIFVAAMTPQSASAQCNYRMNGGAYTGPPGGHASVASRDSPRPDNL